MNDKTAIEETIEYDPEPAVSGEENTQAPKMTLLEIWYTILSNAEEESKARIDMPTAMRIVNNHGLPLKDCGEYNRRYFDILVDAFNALVELIESNPDSIDREREDGVDNRATYLNVILAWSGLLQVRELEWSFDQPNAAAELAAYTDAANFLLGSQGLLAHLEQIDFGYDEDDAQMMRDALTGVEV